MIALSCMIIILGPYMASSLLMSSVVFGVFLIRFLWTAYFRVYVNAHYIVDSDQANAQSINHNRLVK